VHRDGLKLLGERPCTFRGAAIAGKDANVKLLLERHPQYTNAVNAFGACPLHFAAMTSQCLGQRGVVEQLLASGAKPSMDDARHLFFGSVLSTACATYDQDPEAIRMLLAAGADPSKPEVLLPKAKMLRRISRVFRALGNTQMRGLNRILVSLPGRFRQTPAHVAAKRGDVAVMKVLAEHQEFKRAAATADTNGVRPVELAEATWGPNVKGAMTRAIEATNPDALSAPATGAAGAAPVTAAVKRPPLRPRFLPFAGSKAKYRVAPAVAEEVEEAASDETWRARAVHETIIETVSPSMQRAGRPMAAAA